MIYSLMAPPLLVRTRLRVKYWVHDPMGTYILGLLTITLSMRLFASFPGYGVGAFVHSIS